MCQYRYPEHARAALEHFREVVPKYDFEGVDRTIKMKISVKEFDIETLEERPPKHFTGPRVHVQGDRTFTERLAEVISTWCTYNLTDM